MFISARKFYKPVFISTACIMLYAVFVFSKKKYNSVDFGKTFKAKAAAAQTELRLHKENFTLCGKLCHSNPRFMQSIVFPEVMRYNNLKDDIESESLRTLYVQFGEEYADFSIGLFQMKPSFAVKVETKAKLLLPDSVYNQLQLIYNGTDEENIRMQRVERLKDKEWQLVYLTAFVGICNETYKHKIFISDEERMQWYATVYNAGFDKTDEYIEEKIRQQNFYYTTGMPGKKFKYAAIASWFYNQKID
jgi:hypothetical protein